MTQKRQDALNSVYSSNSTRIQRAEESKNNEILASKEEKDSDDESYQDSINLDWMDAFSDNSDKAEEPIECEIVSRKSKKVKTNNQQALSQSKISSFLAPLNK